MHKNHARAIIFPALFLLATAAPSHAQGFISPLIGYDFGGNSGCPEITQLRGQAHEHRVALGSMGTILGFEEEFADAENFFGSVGTQSSSVITIMSNIMIVPAIGPVHPYLLAGLPG